jgi:CBS domain-containing protein
MTSDPISVMEDLSLENVVDALERRRVKRLPVMRD